MVNGIILSLKTNYFFISKRNHAPVLDKCGGLHGNSKVFNR